MESATAVKSRHSDEGWLRELNASRGRRPRRVLWAYCHHHGGGYYFFGIRTHAFKPSEAKRWAGEPNIRRISGFCMACDASGILYVGVDELAEHRYTPFELCECGLPNYHKNPTPQFIQQYNARPVPCRNGRANV